MSYNLIIKIYDRKIVMKFLSMIIYMINNFFDIIITPKFNKNILMYYIKNWKVIFLLVVAIQFPSFSKSRSVECYFVITVDKSIYAFIKDFSAFFVINI
jgi:hypothetical protein